MPYATCTTHKYLWASVCFGGRIEWGTPNLTLPMWQWVSLTLTHTRHVPLNVYCIEMAIRIRGESKATTNLKSPRHHKPPLSTHHQQPLHHALYHNIQCPCNTTTVTITLPKHYIASLKQANQTKWRAANGKSPMGRVTSHHSANQLPLRRMGRVTNQHSACQLPFK